MAHLLLISLTNIDADIHNKGSLHAHLLLVLLPVPSLIHKKSRVRSLLSDRLFYSCLDIVLHPLKIVVSIGIMMSNPYCYTPLVGYIADTPEQCLVSCTSPKSSPISTASHKEFGNGILHPPHTAAKMLGEICAMCSKSNSDDYNQFLKLTKSFGLNGVNEPFWIDWPLSNLAIFDHDLQWCIVVVGNEEINYRFLLIRTLVGHRGFSEGVSKLKQVTGRDHCSMQYYIVGVIAGAVPLQFLSAIHALTDF
ncbi:hypothetical protein OG21DRAFT_1479626 [Imleria badia]|nr:hypothetical protein OG21DRAFT_1479626 [Imleria badia]